MKSLTEELQTPQNSLNEFYNLTERVLKHVENVITGRAKSKGYSIYSSSSAGTTKYTRPINSNLFFLDSVEFREYFDSFIQILKEIRNGKTDFDNDEYFTIDSRS